MEKPKLKLLYQQPQMTIVALKSGADVLTTSLNESTGTATEMSSGSFGAPDRDLYYDFD